MLYTIQNENLRVSISDLGAELMSIKSADGCEYLWQGNPEYWENRAILLFPICGRLYGGKYYYKGKEYRLGLHGFARNSIFEARKQTSSMLCLFLRDNKNTFEQYPFHFEYSVVFSLDNNTLSIKIQVNNTDEKDLIFTVGGHPGFNVPLNDGESFSDYYLEFSKISNARKLLLSDNCFITDKTEPFPLENGIRYNLHHDMFDEDAVFIKDMASAVFLKSSKSSKSIGISYPDFPYVGFWHKPKSEAPFVCIEPWYGLPSEEGIIDNLEKKHHMIHLASGNQWSTEFTISIT